MKTNSLVLERKLEYTPPIATVDCCKALGKKEAMSLECGHKNHKICIKRNKNRCRACTNLVTQQEYVALYTS